MLSATCQLTKSTHPHTTRKHKLKMAYRLQYETRHQRTLRREHRLNVSWHKPYQCFLRSVSQGNRNKSKNKQMGCNQMYKLLQQSKPSTKGRQSMDWENIFANDATNKGLIFKIYKQLIQFNNKTKQQQKKNNQKMDRRTKQTCLPRRHWWPTGTWKHAQHC